MTKRKAALAATAAMALLSKGSSTGKKIPKIGSSSSSSSSSKHIPNKMAPKTNKPPVLAFVRTTATDIYNDDDNNNKQPWYTTMFTKSDEQYDKYMATEWGFEKRGDTFLFETLCLEGAQAGLNWLTILRKREAYRKTFQQFDIDQVSKMTPKDVERILETTSDNPTLDLVVRHKGKIESVIHNAKCIQIMYQENGDNNNDSSNKDILDQFLWSFVNDKPILNTQWKLGDPHSTSAPTKTSVSEAMSKALKQKGFKFVGPTTCYAFMQACGMVVDHPVDSPEWITARQRLQTRPGGYQEQQQQQTTITITTREGGKDKKNKKTDKEPRKKKSKSSRKKNS